MLHIVQVVLSGSAEAPKVYSEEAVAQAAFVECARKYWAQSYAVYCERNGVDSACFSSAQAFVASLDLADRSRIHYWSVTPEDAKTGDTGVAAQPAGEQDALGRLAAMERPSSPPAAASQPSADIYNTKEWKEYVEAIKSMCGGNRSEFHLFTRDDWRQAVYSGQTSFEYWEWVAATIDQYIEKAEQAGYSVVADPDKPGRYRFKTPDGAVSDISNEAEGEAWCRAGLHLEGKCAPERG